ncbi:MAG: chemotaxis protein CheA [Planctomycetaceae bacterium]|nr:chemotaxis protein CheA [Planctomycetaceae bacterium]
MADPHDIPQELADLSARILATDPAQDVPAEEFMHALRQALDVCPDKSPAEGLLKMAMTGLAVLQQNSSSHAGEILEAVAWVVSVSRDCLIPDAAIDAAAIRKAASRLRQLLRSEDVRSPSAAPAEERVTVAAAQAPTPLGLEIDADLLNEFAAESRDRLAGAEAALLALEKRPADSEQINTVLRAFHTIKGAAGFLGIASIERLAHLSENLLICAREGRLVITGRNADMALRSCDTLKDMIGSLRAGNLNDVAVAPGDLESALESISDDGSQVAAAAVAAQAPATAETASDSEKNQPSGDSGIDATARVSIQRLDALVDMVGELVISHSIVAQAPDLGSAAAGSVVHVSKIIRQLQDLAMGLRMVPLKGTFQKMSRLVRDLANKNGKQIRLETLGEETEIDRTMVETIADPLVHMIRNAVDHAIEPPPQRKAAGKDPIGTITLRACHSSGNVIIEMSDDGCGLNRPRILAKAVECGLIEPGAAVSDEQVHELIFHPGLSTAQKVTDVSGRGVGMDVVKRNIEALRGRVEVSSRSGQGCTFTLRLPLTMALAEAMLVRVGGNRYLVPSIAIEHVFRPAAEAISTVAGRGEMVSHRGKLLPIFRLSRLFEVRDAAGDPTKALLMVVADRDRRCVLMVDELVAQQQVVIKSLGKAFENLLGISGGAILGDGKVGLILDIGGIVQLAHEKARAAA